MDEVVWRWMLPLRSPELTGLLAVWSELFRPRWIVLATVLFGLSRLWFSLGGRRLCVAYPAVAIGAAVTLTHLLKPVFDRPRPPEEYRLVAEVSGAMPSGHATGAVALATVTTVVAVRFWWVLLVWLNAVAVMFTRLYLGVHWLSDVLVGAVVGVVVPLLVAVFLGCVWPAFREPVRVPPGGHQLDTKC